MVGERNGEGEREGAERRKEVGRGEGRRKEEGRKKKYILQTGDITFLGLPGKSTKPKQQQTQQPAWLPASFFSTLPMTTVNGMSN